MFNSAAHQPILSLFSSTGSRPLDLFSQTIDTKTPGQSCICLLHDSTSEPRPEPPTILLTVLLSPPPPPPSGSISTGPQVPNDECTRRPSDSQGYTLDQTVLHLQSPDLRRTYVQCPPHVHGFFHHHDKPPGGPERSSHNRPLGIRQPWIHMQVRNLLGKDWSFEVGLVDSAGRVGVLRLSTFQVRLVGWWKRLGWLG